VNGAQLDAAAARLIRGRRLSGAVLRRIAGLALAAQPDKRKEVRRVPGKPRPQA
jgi:hypothetical protein